MAESSEKDPPEKDAPDGDEPKDAPAPAPAEKAAKKAEEPKKAAKPPVEDEEDDEDDEEDDEDEDEDDEEAPPPPKPAAKKAAAAPAAAKTAKGKAKKSSDAPKSKGKLVTPRPMPPRAQGGALGKSLVLFVIVVGGLALGFALLGREGGGGDAAPVPKWNVGQVVDTEVTLVPSDNKDLACAAADEIAGRHCQFEAQNKPWSKSTGDTDEKIFKPYTTTDRIQFLAAGLWDQPALKSGKLPNTRFSVKCKYKVEGKMKKPFIRWSADGQWFERADDWFAGSVSDCTLVNP